MWEEGSLPGQAPVPVGTLELGFIGWSHTSEKPGGSMNVTWGAEGVQDWVNPIARRIWIRQEPLELSGQTGKPGQQLEREGRGVWG